MKEEASVKVSVRKGKGKSRKKSISQQTASIKASDGTKEGRIESSNNTEEASISCKKASVVESEMEGGKHQT